MHILYIWRLPLGLVILVMILYHRMAGHVQSPTGHTKHIHSILDVKQGPSLSLTFIGLYIDALEQPFLIQKEHAMDVHLLV